MKMSRHDRKIFNQGKQAGYFEGYSKGLHDGNPFNALIETLSGFAETIVKNPELLAELKKQREEIYNEGLEEEYDE